MARLSASSTDGRDPEAKEVFGEIRLELGRTDVPRIFAVLSRHPAILRSLWQAVKTILLGGRLPRTTKELIALAVSAAEGSRYSMDQHLRELRALGIEEEILSGLSGRQDSPYLPERTRKILRFAVQAARNPKDLQEGDFERLRSEGLSVPEILEVVSVVGLIKALSTVADALALEAEAAAE
jgi:uncharacterized peroxidase-related enzyme